MYFVGRAEYAFKMAVCFGVYVALTTLFPGFTIWLLSLTNAQQVSGAAGALAVVLGVYLKPLIYLGFVAFVARTCWRRAKTLGFPRAVGLAVPLLMLGDLAFGIAFGAFWAVGFSFGILVLGLPIMLIAALVAMLAMIAFNDENATEIVRNPAYPMWIGCICVLELFAALSLLKFLLPIMMAFLGLWVAAVVIPVLRMVGLLHALWMPHVTLAVFALLSIWIAVQGRSGKGNDPEMRSAPVAAKREFKRFGQRRSG